MHVFALFLWNEIKGHSHYSRALRVVNVYYYIYYSYFCRQAAAGVLGVCRRKVDGEACDVAVTSGTV